MIIEAKRDSLSLINETIENGVVAGSIRFVYEVEDRKFATTVSIAGKTKAQTILEADEAIKTLISNYGDFGQDIEISISGTF